MKRFRFALEPVRRWRQEQARVEEMNLERLREEHAARRRALDALEARAIAEAETVLRCQPLEAASLGVLDSYRKYARREAARMSGEIGQWEQRISGQRKRVIEARRQARLLDRLHERHFEKWKMEAAREQEQLAGELFLARFNSRERA